MNPPNFLFNQLRRNLFQTLRSFEYLGLQRDLLKG